MAKNHTSDVETKLTDSAMHKNIGNDVQKIYRRCSGLMSQNVKYLAVAGWLFLINQIIIEDLKEKLELDNNNKAISTMGNTTSL